MFELDQAIAKWRWQMAADGIKSPALLDELESHLQEDVERQAQAGKDVEAAFHTAVVRLGQPSALTNEFSKVGETNEALARLKYFLLTLAGIQNPILATNMNTSSTNPEPAWATYLKSSAFALPAATLWLFIAVFVFPKFNQIISQSGFQLSGIFGFLIGLALFLTHNMVFIGGGFILALVLLEWRFKKWPQYRRAAFGIGTFLLNSAVLISITAMVILAVVVAAVSLQHAK